MKITVQEVTIISGETASIDLWIDSKKVKIKVPKEVKAYFNEQFVRENPSARQKKNTPL